MLRSQSTILRATRTRKLWKRIEIFQKRRKERKKESILCSNAKLTNIAAQDCFKLFAKVDAQQKWKTRSLHSVLDALDNRRKRQIGVSKAAVRFSEVRNDEPKMNLRAEGLQLKFFHGTFKVHASFNVNVFIVVDSHHSCTPHLHL